MAEKRVVNFRLNGKSADDEEIIRWINKVCGDGKLYDNQTECMKAVLLKEIRSDQQQLLENEQTEQILKAMVQMNEQNQKLYLNTMEDFVARMFTGMIGTINQMPRAAAYPTVMQENIDPHKTSVQNERVETPVTQGNLAEENNVELELSSKDTTLDGNMTATLASLFGDDEGDDI